MKRRTLAIIVAVLVLCWFGLTALGLSGGSAFAGQMNLEAPSARQFRERFTARLKASSLRLAAGDAAACPLDASRLATAVNAVCVYAIQPDPGKTRKLSLALAEGGQSVKLLLEQPEYLRVDQTLKPGEAADLDIFDSKEEARLIITACVVDQTKDDTDNGTSESCVLEIIK